ncbi:hypothetical protein Lepto7376_3687 [[Leptolyngbya] sp. PCC 7376]|uniref:hypothetical protein n=1 Tax=[Leptolyngbya] sp. PCC 7376 TaxID=111781 RepID=UPI00029ED123|nr:hypothetical protein [[Leptolyngbya] sp. PCC 7376]AFY39863.1 hypothetical protein Lepto7376_3687 [[Leptolyngbya] sp. PCC 7376]
MLKYFVSYAVGGCLAAITLSAFITEIARLLPEIIPAALIFWAVVAVISGVVLKVSGYAEAFGAMWIWSNILIGLGVGLGIA